MKKRTIAEETLAKYGDMTIQKVRSMSWLTQWEFGMIFGYNTHSYICVLEKKWQKFDFLLDKVDLDIYKETSEVMKSYQEKVGMDFNVSSLLKLMYCCLEIENLF